MYKNDIHLSKFLSWLLRHGANKGFNLSPEGYLEIDKILQHKNLKGKYTRSDIERVVNNNDKQRFKLRWNAQTNTTEIKANQGHSIDVEDTDLMLVLKPKYETVVHGTYYFCWTRIKAEGLCRMKRRHIHLSKGTLGTNIVSGLRNNIQIYIFIDLAKALADRIKFYESENGVILTPGNEKGFLAPKYFLKVIDVKTASDVTMNPKKENVKNPPITNKIHVKGFPSYTRAQDLTRVFSEYGTVSLDRLTKRFATLTFAKDDDANAAVRDSTKLVMHGELLIVKHHQPQLEALNTPKKDYPLTQKRDEIVSPFRINLSGEFLQQVNNIMGAVRLTQEEVNRLGRLYSDLERVLQVLWPGCKAIPFGSITTGLGIKSSDADCFISIPRLLHHPNDNHVGRATRVLYAHPEIFTEIIPIPRANTPIIKFYHLPSETNCDVTFKTPLGTQNSMLIAFLLQSDRRFIPMAVIIKYWAKVHDLSGTRKLTNYALVLMIIFYLQQHPISMLPSIHWLQQNPVDDYIIDFWNAGFMKYIKKVPPSSRSLSMLDLLGGFFQFYCNFNFKDLVVCPYLGRPINKEIFSDTVALPHEFERYKFNVERNYVLPIKYTTSMCVQDPIDQSHNVASAVSNKLANDVQEFFKYAAEAYEQDKHSGCKNFLRTILLQKPKIVRFKPTSEYRINLRMRGVGNFAGHDWKTVVKEIVDVVFEDMLKITLYKMEEKLVEPQKEKVKFVGTVTRAVWKRKQFTRLYNAKTLDFAERQSRITDEIMKVDKTVFELKFQVLAIFYNKPKVRLGLKHICGDMNLFREFGKFFNGIVSTWLRTLIQPHLTPVATKEPVDVAETIRSIDSNLDSSSDSDDDSSAENNSLTPAFRKRHK